MEFVMDLNNVEFPERFVRTAGEWYGGQGCILYAVSSTGGLTRGSIRPDLCDDDGNYTPATDEAWIRYLWDELDITLSRNIRNLLKRPKGERKGLRDLQAFSRWVTGILRKADAAFEPPKNLIADDSRVLLYWKCARCGRYVSATGSAIQESGIPLCECAETSYDMVYVGVSVKRKAGR